MHSIKMIIFSMTFICLASVSFAAGAVVTKGKMIKMDYTLFVNNEEIESSVGKQPLNFVYGDQSIIPGLEKAIEGMKVAEEKTVKVSPKDAYGEADPQAIKEFPRSNLPAKPEPVAGMVLQAQAPDGESFPAVITEVKGDKVTLDFNHPLAGQELTFKIKIIDIANPSAGSSSATASKPATK